MDDCNHNKKINADSPMISVVVPIYNVERYIERCLESIIIQTYENIEIVLVDDGSLDKSMEICARYAALDDRIKIFHKKNGGLSDARNYGINRSNGEYITCIDADDYVDKDYIEYLYYILAKYNTAMSICQHRIHYENEEIKELGSSGDVVMSTEDCLEHMLYHNTIDTSAWAKLYKKTLFNEVCYPKGKLFEDIGTTYALIMQCDMVAVGYESKYNYIFHEDSIVNSEFNLSKLDMIQMTDKMAKDVSKAYPNLIKATNRRQVYSRFSTLNQMLATNEYQNIKDEIISFIKKNGISVLKDKNAPSRDKIAIILLQINYGLYKKCWTFYRSYIMKK